MTVLLCQNLWSFVFLCWFVCVCRIFSLDTLNAQTIYNNNTARQIASRKSKTKNRPLKWTKGGYFSLPITSYFTKSNCKTTEPFARSLLICCSSFFVVTCIDCCLVINGSAIWSGRPKEVCFHDRLL